MEEIEEADVVMSEITGNALVLLSDYYTAPVTIKEFNAVKQSINLQVLKLIEELQIEIAGASTELRISKKD